MKQNKGTTLIPRPLTHFLVFGVFTVDTKMESRWQQALILNDGVTTSSHFDLGGAIVTDLHRAASVGNYEDARKVILGGGRKLLSRKDGEGNLPLHLAVQGGHKDVVLYLLDEYPQGSLELNKEGMSPLYLAVAGGPSTDLLVPILESLSKNAEKLPLHKIKEGKSIIRAAITFQNQEMVKTILSNQSVQSYLINLKDEKGLTPLSYAAEKGCSDIVEYLLLEKPQKSSRTDAIHKACLGGHVNVLKIFYSSSPESLLKPNKHGQNILHLAAKQRGNKLKDVVSYLLKLQDTNINKLKCQQDENGYTPLEWAQNNMNGEVIKLLE